MNPVTIIVGDDTLGTGEEAGSTVDQFNRRHAQAVDVNECDLIGEDFREFERHLRRQFGTSSYGWTYRENRSGRHQRTYYFDNFVTLEPVVLSPGKPSGVAALAGKDPYTDPGDIDFLLKGDRFRAERQIGKTKRKEVVYGTAAMDGHAISPNHGWLIHEAQGHTSTAKAKRSAYENVEGGYINVNYDHREPGYYSGHRSNESLMLKEGWTIYVLPEVARRKTKVLAEHRKNAQRSQALLKVESTKQQLAKAERALKDAQIAVATAEMDLRNLK